MIHEIAPRVMHNEFRSQFPLATDYLFYFEGENVLLCKNGDSCTLPTFEKIAADNEGLFPLAHYLFSIDETAFCLTEKKPVALNDSFVMESARCFRHFAEPWLGFAGATASHLWCWERVNKFCGVCGSKMDRHKKERAFTCSHCENIVYSRIAPVVIVAVNSGDKLLMARNLNNVIQKLFLISGFVDVGESLEEAVVREVKEEMGIAIKNIRYITSQPWGFSNSLIAGFTAELEGDGTLHIQEDEIAEAAWVDRKDIPEYDPSLSISSLLIEMFRKQQS